MKTEMILRINREGEFIAIHESQSTENQCGKPGAKKYRYFVTIEATNRRLTAQGFVMENLWVADYFRERYETRQEPCRSCEDMAQEAVRHFGDLFTTVEELKGVDLRRIYVRIHGSDVSFIEAEWKNTGV